MKTICQALEMSIELISKTIIPVIFAALAFAWLNDHAIRRGWWKA